MVFYNIIASTCYLEMLHACDYACAHVVNEQWVWRMADKFACTFKPTR